MNGSVRELVGPTRGGYLEVRSRLPLQPSGSDDVLCLDIQRANLEVPLPFQLHGLVRLGGAMIHIIIIIAINLAQPSKSNDLLVGLMCCFALACGGEGTLTQ